MFPHLSTTFNCFAHIAMVHGFWNVQLQSKPCATESLIYLTLCWEHHSMYIHLRQVI